MGVLSQSWVEAIQKEENLRLRWYLQNEQNLRKSAALRPNFVTDDDRAEMVALEKRIIKSGEHIVSRKVDDAELPPPETNIPSEIMKPVPKEVRNVIYTSGRKPYLNARIHLLPEDRYHFPEISSFTYGWRMWDCAKTMTDKRYGKSAIIRQSFYRRRAGIEKDPDWYRSPIMLSPTVCKSAN